jgi:hypothetical protein
MRTIVDVCGYRDEASAGDSRGQRFAAWLTKVVRGTAGAVSRDRETLSANIYATGGLKSILGEALGRLPGAGLDEANPGTRFCGWTSRFSVHEGPAVGVSEA